MDAQVWLGFFRHMLTMMGGVFIAKGWATEDTMPELIGAIMTLIGFVWSYMNKTKVKAEVKALENKK